MPAPEPVLQFEPIAGFTTSRHAVPEEGIAAPIGSSVEFVLTGIDPSETVHWSGDGVERATARSASVEVTRSGPMSVRAECQPSGRVFTCDVFPAAMTARSLQFDVNLEEANPAPFDVELTNMESIDVYLWPSIGAVHGDKRTGYSFSSQTSVRGKIVPQRNARADAVNARLNRRAIPDAAMASLVEWRVNGTPMGIGDVDLSALQRGRHHIEIGPPKRSRSIDITVYETTIESAYGEDVIPTDRPITFTATTNPPGFEGQIRWLASTKYGEVAPQFGEGPSFATTFVNTFGVTDGVLHEWLGIRADDDFIESDVKAEVDLLDMLQRTRALTDDTLAQLEDLNSQLGGARDEHGVQIINAIAELTGLQDRVDEAIASYLNLSTAEVTLVKEALRFVLPHVNDALDTWAMSNDSLREAIGLPAPGVVSNAIRSTGMAIQGAGDWLDDAGQTLQDEVPIVGDTLGIATKTVGVVAKGAGVVVDTLGALWPFDWGSEEDVSLPVHPNVLDASVRRSPRRLSTPASRRNAAMRNAASSARFNHCRRAAPSGARLFAA